MQNLKTKTSEAMRQIDDDVEHFAQVAAAVADCDPKHEVSCSYIALSQSVMMNPSSDVCPVFESNTKPCFAIAERQARIALQI